MALLPFANAPGSSGGSGTVTSVSVATANGFSGTVANPTTTPSITIIAGAITPTSVNSIVLSGSSTPTLAVTGTSSISGANTGDQTITLTGAVTGSGTGSFATTIQSSIALPGSPTTTTQAATDNSTKIATTAYVTTGISNAISGVNPAIAVQAATTGAGNTSGFTYNNGVSGIGATLTQNSAAIYVVDGFTFNTIGQRLLVKNDTQAPSGAFNGVYFCTTVGTAIIPAVFTRALDYDTPSDINNTGAIPVVNGTVNALTSWLLTSSIATVGTDPLTYTQFSYSPTSVIPPNLGGTGIANNASSTLTISGSFATTLTVSNTTAVTLPTSGTLYGTATGSITSAQLATSLTDETGSGLAVFATSPSLTTPTLGVASATSINKVTITAPATSAILTIANGKTLTASNTLTLAGTDSKTLTISNSLTLAGTDSTIMTFPATSDTVAGLGTVQTWTAAQTFTDGDFLLKGSSSGTTTLKATAAASGTITFPAATDTVVTLAATQTLTNKTLTTPTIDQFNTASGLGAAWGTWSPTLTGITIGNGSVIARYIQIGKTVYFRVQITFGTTTTLPTSADNKFSVPVAINTSGYTQYFAGLGSGMFKISTSGFVIAPMFFDTNTIVMQGIGTLTTGQAAAVDTNVFGSPGSGSIIQVQGFYETT